MEKLKNTIYYAKMYCSVKIATDFTSEEPFDFLIIQQLA